MEQIQSICLSGKKQNDQAFSIWFTMRLTREKNEQKYTNPTPSSELCGCLSPEICGGGKGNYSFLM